MRKWLILFSVSFSLSFTYGQSSITSWSKTDSIPNSDDIIVDVLQMPDSGYVLAGNITIPARPYTDNLLIRTDKNGDTLWTKIWGTTAYDGIATIALRPGGGFVVAGSGNSRSFVFLDSIGNILSTHYYGDYTFSDVTVLPDSGFIFVGYSGAYPSNSDVAIMRADKNGDTLWTKHYGTIRGDAGRAITATTDGNFVIAGEANYYYYADGTYTPNRAYILKIDLTGDTLWTDTIPGSVVYRSVAFDVLENKIGEYVITGSSSSSNGLLAAYSSSGSLNWYKEYVNPFSSTGYTSYVFYNLEQKCDGGYIMVGYETRPSPSTFAGLVVSTNSAGDTLFTNAYGDATTQVFLRSIISTLDSGYFVGGYSMGAVTYTKNPYLLKLDGQAGNNNLGVITCNYSSTSISTSATFTDLSNGATNWYWDFGDGNFSSNQNPIHAYSAPANYYVCLKAWNYCDTAYYCDSITINNFTTSAGNISNELLDMSVFPQPSTDMLNICFISKYSEKISFRFYDAKGNEFVLLASSSTISVGKNNFTIDISKLPQGLYILETFLNSGEKYKSKIIKIN